MVHEIQQNWDKITLIYGNEGKELTKQFANIDEATKAFQLLHVVFKHTDRDFLVERVK